MATKSASLQKKLDTLKKALGNKFIPASQKEKLKTQIDKIEKDMSSKKSSKSSKSAGAKASISKLDKLIKNKKYGVYKGAGVDLKKDGERPAKPIGKRKSKSGNTYYEYRANRIDVKQPSKKAPYPKLAKGGQINMDRHIWEGWTVGNFIQELDIEFRYHPKFKSRDEVKKWAMENQPYYKKYIPEVVDYYWEKNEQKYAKGGSLTSIKEEYEENEDNNAHSENVVLLAKHFGSKEDLAEAKKILALHEKEGHLTSENGKKRQELHLKLIEKARAEMGKEGIEFAKGGEVIMTDVYAKKDGKKVKVNERPMELKEAEKWVKEQGIEKYYTDVDFKYINKDFGYMAEGGVTEKDVVDSNAQMVLSQIKAVKHHADELSRVVSMKSNIEAWVVGKIERASTGLSDITHYLEGNKQMMSMGGSVRYYTHKMDKK